LILEYHFVIRVHKHLLQTFKANALEVAQNNVKTYCKRIGNQILNPQQVRVSAVKNLCTLLGSVEGREGLATSTCCKHY
jgi:hypothetical protein